MPYYFTDRLKELRKTKGVTKKAMAEYLGIVERSYSRYEAGDLEPNHEKTIKLADYFDVSLDYLVGRSDTPGAVYFTRAKFAERLEELRIKKAVTQRVVAECLGIQEDAYQMYEFDKREPGYETTIKLADYFDVSADYLLGRSDNPERH